MPRHPLVDQLRFTRAEFMRAIKGVPAADAMKRLLPELDLAGIRTRRLIRTSPISTTYPTTSASIT